MFHESPPKILLPVDMPKVIGVDINVAIFTLEK